MIGDAHRARFRHYECGVSMLGKRRRLQRVMKTLPVPASRAIHVGDQVPDGEAARAAGMAFGAVAWGYATPASLMRCGPAEVFDTPADLCRIAGADA